MWSNDHGRLKKFKEISNKHRICNSDNWNNCSGSYCFSRYMEINIQSSINWYKIMLNKSPINVCQIFSGKDSLLALVWFEPSILVQNIKVIKMWIAKICHLEIDSNKWNFYISLQLISQ